VKGLNWIVRKGLSAIITIFTAITFTFFIIHLMPGNPIDAYIDHLISLGWPPDRAEELVKYIFNLESLNEPIWKKYVSYVRDILTGNLGHSFMSMSTPVSLVLAYALPWTAFLVSISLSLSFVVGVVTGMFIAYRRGGVLDSSVTLIGSIMASIPSYIFASIFAFVFCAILRIFPAGGAYSAGVTPGFNWPFISDVLYHSVVPMSSYFITGIWVWLLSMRSSTISILGQDYVVAAEARGLHKRRIAMTYVGRNAILPLFTTLAVTIGSMFGNGIFIETMFAYPGIGYIIGLGVSTRDYPIIMGCFLVITVAVVAANFIADLLYGKLDPRIKIK